MYLRGMTSQYYGVNLGFESVRWGMIINNL
eukprot:SAG31_NODE_15149_length_768_cov_0.581465_1_plen_29_part_10